MGKILRDPNIDANTRLSGKPGLSSALPGNRLGGCGSGGTTSLEGSRGLPFSVDEVAF